jgi:hypothetical protein
VEKILHYRPHSGLFIIKHNICTLMCQIRRLSPPHPLAKALYPYCVLCRCGGPVYNLWQFREVPQYSHSDLILVLFMGNCLSVLSSYSFFLSRGLFQVEDEVGSQPLTHFRLLPPISDLALLHSWIAKLTRNHSKT